MRIKHKRMAQEGKEARRKMKRKLPQARNDLPVKSSLIYSGFVGQGPSVNNNNKHQNVKNNSVIQCHCLLKSKRERKLERERKREKMLK